MIKSAIPLVIISGPVGVGKTSIGQEMSEQLARLDIVHTFIDLDALAQTYPRPKGDPYGSRLAVRNLQALWLNCVEAGSLNVIVARVVESIDDVSAIERAVPGSKAHTVQLRASEAALRSRVGAREKGSAHDWHVNRAIELSRSLAATGPRDIVIETDGRQIADIAKEIIEGISWAQA